MSNPISANDVKRLRDMTNAPMMDCKKALGEANGDFEKAIQWLREQNKMKGEKVAARETAEGRIGVFIDPAKAVAAIVELRCESAPVAKSDIFIQLATDVAKHVALSGAAANPEELLGQPFAGDPKRKLKDRIEDAIGLIRENMRPARFAKLSGGQFGSYVHFDGSVGVLIQVEGTAAADPQMLKDVCMHITAKQPAAARREEVDPATIEREREIAKHQAAQSGKPPQIAEKIAEGKLKTWFAENVLVEQPFVKDDSKTVGGLLQSAGLTVKKFVRLKVGELT
jgi:elongation factor Ts